MIEFPQGHCAFWQDNGRGRCIAKCHYNDREPGVDCMGEDGPTMHSITHSEVQAGAQFIDGTHKEIVHNHEDGTYTVTGIYNPPVPKPESSNKTANLLTLPYQQGRVTP